MRVLNDLMMDNVSYADTSASVPVNVEHIHTLSVQASWTVNTPSAKTFDSGVKSTLVVQDLTYTADAYGTGGDAITIEYTAGGTAGSEVVTVVGNAISVQIDDGVSTATQVKAAVDAKAEAAALVDVTITGTGSNAQSTAAATPLASGVDSELNQSTEVLSIPSHGFLTGLKGQLTTTNTLPTGLSTGTDYWVIKVTDDTIKLAESLADAQAGTAVDITGEGVGVHTFTPTSIAGGTLKLQATNDDALATGVTPTWSDLSNSQTVSATSSYMFKETDVSYRYVRIIGALTAGQVSVTARINAKGF